MRFDEIHTPSDQQLVESLMEGIENNLQNEHFGVKELAKESGFSKSHLNRKLKAILGQTTNQFIREYRLKKAMELLQHDVATAAEVAYLVGFGSPSYFSTCFRDFYGYPPSVVHLRKSIASPPAKINLKKLLRISVGAFALIVLLSIAYFIFYSTSAIETETPESIQEDKSIAILPFKNLSTEEDDQYLADGVQQAIYHQLSRNSDLSLRSVVSTEIYRETKFNSKDIGEQLGVNYILTGTFQKVDNQAYLIIRLIKTKTDKLAWSKEYSENWSDIFEVQRKIARKVSEDLDTNYFRRSSESL